MPRNYKGSDSPSQGVRLPDIQHDTVNICTTYIPRGTTTQTACLPLQTTDKGAESEESARDTGGGRAFEPRARSVRVWRGGRERTRICCDKTRSRERHHRNNSNNPHSVYTRLRELLHPKAPPSFIKPTKYSKQSKFWLCVGVFLQENTI